MTNYIKELAKEIRDEFKKAGFNSRQVSVRASSPGFDSSINITIKDYAVPEMLAEQMYRYESIDRDEWSGEILAGGNTYIFIIFDINCKGLTEEDIALAQKQIDEAAKLNYGAVMRLEDGITITKSLDYNGCFEARIPDNKVRGHYLKANEFDPEMDLVSDKAIVVSGKQLAGLKKRKEANVKYLENYINTKLAK